jgi:hypothetical protein
VGEERFFVLVRRTRPREVLYLRAYPRTAADPTPAQIRARIAFGEAARKAKGIKYRGLPVSLPPAAEFVKRELSGKSFEPKKEKKPKWLELLEKMLSGYPPEAAEKALELARALARSQRS